MRATPQVHSRVEMTTATQSFTGGAAGMAWLNVVCVYACSAAKLHTQHSSCGLGHGHDHSTFRGTMASAFGR